MNATTMLILLFATSVFVMASIRMQCSVRKQEDMIGKCMTIGDREVQEDTVEISVTSAGILAVLADGMGKCCGGKIAGRIAVETFVDFFQDYHACDNPKYFFRKAFNAANRAILNKIEDGRGSTCVAAAVILNHKLYYALVGNSKIAIYRDGDLVPVSEGHTIDVLAKQKYVQGTITKESALSLLDKHRLYNFVGQDGFKDIELLSEPLPLRKNDLVVLMSDGVFEFLRWCEIEDILAKGGSSQKLALEVIEAINRSKKPNKDNASIILIRQ